MKDFLKTFVIGGLGGAVFLLGIAPTAYKYNFLNSAKLIDQVLPAREIQKVKEEIITFVSEEKKSETAISKSRDSVVAVKSFRGGLLIRFGSGVVFTQDGLIVTANQVVPEGATNYQVISDDKILNAKVVLRSVLKNLALLKVSDDSLKPADFSGGDLKVGNIVFVVGKLALLQKPELFANRAFVSLIDNQSKKIVLDGRYENYLSGAGLVSDNGNFRGLIYVDGERIIALPSTFVEEFAKNYLK